MLVVSVGSSFGAVVAFISASEIDCVVIGGIVVPSVLAVTIVVFGVVVGAVDVA